MSPATHFLTGWVLSAPFELSRRDRALMVAGAVISDVDALAIVPELLTRNSEHPLAWFTLYHHSLHTLLFCAVFTLGAFFLANQKWKTAGLCFLTFHSHLL